MDQDKPRYVEAVPKAPDPRTPGTLEVTKEIDMHAAHRLRKCNLTPPCTRVHGHTYRLQATWEIEHCPDHLDEEGMVTNFVNLKKMLAEVKDLFDHHLINEADLPEVQRLGKCTFDPDKVTEGVTLLETTAEMMVWWIGEYLLTLTKGQRPQIKFVEATLWETETSSATWRPAAS